MARQKYQKQIETVTDTVEPDITTPDSTEAKVEAPKKEVEYDAVAVGHIALPGGKYKIFRILVDSKSGDTGGIEVLKNCDDKSDMVYEFKIAAARNGLV